MLPSLFFGAFWGLLIFNLDRYIVATIGKGDGTSKITKEEWKIARPRLLMAILLGIVIATPLELKIFEKEIETVVERLKIAVSIPDYETNLKHRIRVHDAFSVRPNIVVNRFIQVRLSKRVQR